MRFPGFIGGSYQALGRTAAQERTINLYVERMESPGATAPSALYLVPGVESIGEYAGSPGRAHFYENGREFAVIGTAFVEISENGTATSRGTVAQDTYPATICSNGDGGGQLLIVSGDKAYCYTLATNTLAEIAALSGKATMGSYLDGYGLVLDSDTSTLYISALLDFASWTTGTDFAQRSKAPDKWKSMRVNGQYIGLFGEHTSEFWYNSGAASFPFEPHPSGLIPYGIAAPWSLTNAEGVQYWVGQSTAGQYYLLRATAFTPEIVSDFPNQLAFQGLTEPSSCVGEAFNWNGHVFVRLSFPADATTYCYDASNNSWFEWRTWLAESNAYGAHRPRFHAMAFGEHRMLDSETGDVYRLSGEVYIDADDRPIRWVRRAPAIIAGNERIFYAALEIALDVGEGLVSGQGEDPQITLRMSNDNGKTWGAEVMRSVGKLGEYGRRVRWNRLGAARQRVFELSGTDPIPWRIADAFLTLGGPIQAAENARAGVSA